MFVGDTGVSRIVERTAALMKQAPGEDVSRLGGIPLDMIQRSLNYWYSISLDLFGGEISSNAASYFASSLKGRAHEMKKYQDHLALEGTVNIDVLRDGKVATEAVPVRNALNELLRDEYADDNQKAVDRWNRELAEAGITGFEFKLPSKKFNRAIGEYAGHHFDPSGQLISEETWQKKKDEWLVTEADRAYVASIQRPVVEPGKMASWIAPPRVGIKGRPIDFQYVRL